MPDELQQTINDGVEAEALITSDVFKAACKRARAMAIDEWARTHAGDVTLRESAYHLYKAIDRVEQALTAIKGDGDMAKQTLRALQQQQKPNPIRRQ